jgi:hypothetical protein
VNAPFLLGGCVSARFDTNVSAYESVTPVLLERAESLHPPAVFGLVGIYGKKAPDFHFINLH